MSRPVKSDEASVERVLDAFARTTDEIVTLDELRNLLRSGRQMRIKYGVGGELRFFFLGPPRCQRRPTDSRAARRGSRELVPNRSLDPRVRGRQVCRQRRVRNDQRTTRRSSIRMSATTVYVLPRPSGAFGIRQ